MKEFFQSKRRWLQVIGTLAGVLTLAAWWYHQHGWSIIGQLVMIGILLAIRRPTPHEAAPARTRDYRPGLWVFAGLGVVALAFRVWVLVGAFAIGAVICWDMWITTERRRGSR